MLQKPVMSARKLFFLLVIFQIIAAAPLAAEDTLYVQVRSSKVRSEPKFLAPAQADVSYGQKLTVIGKPEGTWFHVKAGGASGYVHASAVTTREVVVSKGGKGKDIPVDNSDIVVAGKGFNAQVEKEFAAKNASLNFSAVDNMERLRVADSELSNFMRAGKLIR